MKIIPADRFKLPIERNERSSRLITADADQLDLPVSVCPYPYRSERLDFVVPHGLTLAEIVDVLPVDPLLKEHGHVFLGDALIERVHWRSVRPKPDALVSIRLLPAGGGAARIGLMIGIAALAITATVLLPGIGVPVFAAALIGAGITMGGGLLVNLLLPPPVAKMSKGYGNDPHTYAITGQRNQMRPWAKVPFIGGKFKVTPSFAAMPYREVVGGDIYWRALFAIGHGPLWFDDLAIGQTALGEYQGVDVELRRGYWSLIDMGTWNAATGVFPGYAEFGWTWTVTNTGSAGGVVYTAGNTITYSGVGQLTEASAWDVNQGQPFQLFPSDVYEDALAVKVIYGSPQTRSTRQGADEVGIELIFERGIVHLQNVPAGKRSDTSVTVAIQQAPVGTENWTTVLQTQITGRQTTPIYWGHRWKTTDAGTQDANRQYDIRIHRLTGDFDEERNFGNFTWYAVRTFTMQTPLPQGSVAAIALRVKASGQLSGTLDEFNCIATSMCSDWNAQTNAWVWRASSSPAAIYRHILQHPARLLPATDAQIDLDRLAYWDNVTRPAGRNFNGVFDTKNSLYDSLIDVCRVGRAVPTLRDMRYSIVIDEPKTSPIRMFTPANSWDYTGEITHMPVPNAYRVGYVNAEKDYATSEVVVYDDGYSEANANRTELVQWIGIDNQAQAWKEGRYHLAQQRLRREVHKITTDFEHLCCERGDLVALQYDTIAVGLGAARVIAVTEIGALVSAVTLDAAVTMEAGKSYNIRVRRVTGNTQRTDLYNVVTQPGEQETLSMESPPVIGDSPDVGDLVAFGERGRETLRVLVRDIEPKPDLTAVLTLISEGAGVHVAEFGPIPPWDPVVTVPRRLPAPIVLGIQSDARVMMVTASRMLIDRVVFSLQPISFEGVYIRIIYRPMGVSASWETAAIQSETPGMVAIVGPESGESYDFRLQYLHPSYLGSPITSINSYYVVGRAGAPLDLENLTLGVIGGQALLRWDPSVDVDVQIGGWVMFRHSPDLENALWPNTTTIAQAVVGDQTHVFLPLKPGTYFGRVYDADGRASPTPVGISTKQASVLAFSPVNEIVEHPVFTGNKAGVAIINGGLMLAESDFDSVVDTDLLVDWDVSEGMASEGEYTFSAGIDLGSVQNVRVTSHVKMEAINVLDYWDSRAGVIDDWEDIDGTALAVVDAQIYAQMTDDDPAATPEWGVATRIDSLEINNRAVGNIKCKMSTADATYNLWITELRIEADQLNIAPTTIDYDLDGGGPSA